jgi:hypothetical protein
MLWGYLGNGFRQSNAGAASLTPAIPTGLTDNTILIAVAAAKSAADITTATAGWTRIDYATRSGPFSAAVFWAFPGAAAPVIMGTTLVTAQVMAFEYGNQKIAPSPIGVVSANNGSGNPHSSTGFNATYDRTLAVLVDLAAANTFATAPAGWTNHVQAGSNTGASFTLFASRTLAAAGDPSGNPAFNGATNEWIQWQFEILLEQYPAGAVVDFLEPVAIMGPPAGGAFPIVEAVPWIRSGVGCEVAILEMVAWMREPTVISGRRRQVYNN